jgi:transcriptional regulator with XRE-family HTH domain
MNNFGQRVRELRQHKGLTLRDLAPQVGFGHSYLRKVERGRLDFGDSPSESLIHRLADALEGDEDELLLLAYRISAMIKEQIFDHSEILLDLAWCNEDQLQKIGKRTKDVIGCE